MPIKLQDLTSELKLDSSPFAAGSKLALAGIGALLAGVAAVGAGIGIMVAATFKWADEVDGLGDVMGGTNKQMAAFAYIARKSGVSIDKFTQANTILEKGLLKSNGTLDVTGKKLKEFGINVKDANGVVKDQVTLTDEIAQKYANLGTQQEKVNFLTEIYGKSGAQLIDFFDTLAQEGGIDTVADKVERLGLAIDPSRYEMFNRNLEELKLIALGLAVAFTEKIMPVLEGFLKLLSDPKAIDISKIANWVDTVIGVFLKGLGDKVNKWISEGGPEALTEKIVSWIEDIGDSPTLATKAEIGARHLLNAIVKAIKEIGWKDIATAIDTKVAEGISSHDWKASGDAFGEGIDKAISEFFTGGNKFKSTEAMDGRWLLKILLPGIDALITFFQTSNTGQAITDAIADWFDGLFADDRDSWLLKIFLPGIDGLIKFFQTVGVDIMDGFKNGWDAGVENIDKMVQDWVDLHIIAPIKNALGISSPSTVFYSIATDMIAGLVNGWAASVATFLTKLTTLKTDIENKLRDISKEFYNRALAWAGKAAEGFTDGKETLLKEIRAIVTAVNIILKKIITSFVLTFSAQQGGATGEGGLGGSNAASAGWNTIGNTDNRAVGGNVSAGQLYNVNELGKGEYFLPAMNGRIEPESRQRAKETRLDDYTIRAIADAFAENALKAA